MGGMRISLIGPTYPYRGGIAHYTTLLAEQLRQDPAHDLLFISFARQYPAWLYKGRSDRDPSQQPIRTNAEYLLSPLNPTSWWRTLRRLREWRPELVVMQWWVPFWAPVWSILGRGIRRLPGQPRLYFICHNVLPHEQGGPGRRVLPAVTRLALAPADGFLVHSRADGQVLQQLLPDAVYRVTPLPTYEALGQGPADALPFEVPGDRPLLLFAGFVRPYKGLDVLLKALPAVLRARPVHLLVAGEFWEDADDYRQQIANAGIENAVTIVDAYLPDEVLAACLARADVVVLPYRHATQSAVIQLAFGKGRPVITTDVGGLSEVVEDGRTGLVVPPEDPAALAAAINRFFEEALGPSFQENITEAQGKFAWGNLVETVLQLDREQGKRGQTGISAG